MPLVENATLRKLRADGLALGFGVHHLRTAAAGMLAAAAGHDWLFIDMEHGAFSQDDVAQICVASCGEIAPCSMSMNSQSWPVAAASIAVALVRK